MTRQGTIVRWDATRAFGFIRSAGSAGEVFFHIRDYRGATPPREGLAVEFEEIHVGGKGPRAMAVRTVGGLSSPAAGARSSGSTRPREPENAKRSAGTRSATRGRGRAPSPVAGATLAYGLMLAWAALLAWGLWTQRLPLWTLAALAAVNAVTLWMYAADKNAARAGRWRVSESQLHLLSLLGGWPAAWLAQQNMRHKTSKAQFRALYWATIVLHCAGLAALVLTGSAGLLWGR